MSDDERTRRARINDGRRDVQSFWSSSKGVTVGFIAMGIAVVGFIVAVIR